MGSIWEVMAAAITSTTTVEKLLSERLGHGSFGIVYKAFYNDSWAAAKKFQKPQNLQLLKRINQTSETLIDLKHENLIQIYEIIFEKEIGYIMMEYAENGTLHDFLHGKSPPTNYSLQVALNWGLQIAEGIAFLHELSSDPLIHGGIRPEKILLSKGGRKLKITGLDLRKTRNISYNVINNHMAPEMIENHEYTEKIDIYSWGITFWELLTLKEPKYDVELDLNGMLDGTPDAVKGLICKCVNRSPTRRCSMRNAVTSLKKIISNSSSTSGWPLTLEEIKFTDLHLHKKLGYGSTGSVYKGFCRDGMIAVRQIYYTINPMQVKKKLTELSYVNHINVTLLHGISFHDGTIHLILEYAENGSLHEFIHGPSNYKYSYKLGINWGIQMAKGMAYLHGMKPNPIIHGNVNPRNILLFRGGQLLKLSLPLPSKKRYSVYRAPEVVANNILTVKSDIYSWAVVMWEILTRTEPSKDLKRLFAHATECPQEIRKLIINCSEKSAAKRPTLKIIIDQLMIHFKELNVKTQNENNTQLQQDLCSGSIGTVCLWQDVLIAVKRLHNIKDTGAIHSEINNLTQLNHVNILDIYGFTLHDNFTYCLMEYAINGSLHDFLHGEWQPKYSLYLAIHWGVQLAEGIAYLHSISVAHGAINPKNILLTANCRLVKICYFGSVTSMAMAKATDIWYRAPEVNTNGYLTCKSDIYSWAITMNEILRREEPKDEPYNSFAKIVLTDDGQPIYDSTLMADCPELFISLMNDCWKKEQFDRPDISHVIEELKTLFYNSRWEVKVLPDWESTESVDSTIECPCCFKCNIL